MLIALANAVVAEPTTSPLGRRVGTLAIRCVKAQQRKPKDKGWDAKVSYRTYQKLHAQGIL